MAYTINRYDGTTLTNVQDGTINEVTDIKLVGRNYAGYGEIQNENFVYLLENFANINPPPKPVSGQIWFDSSSAKLKFYDGTKFRTTGGAEVNDSSPTGLTEGDFWWDTANEQLYAFNGTDFILIGPQDAGEGITQMQSRTIIDTAGSAHSVIVSVLNDQVVHIISNDNDFQIQPTPENAIPGFDIVKKGITLVNTQLATQGVTSTDHIFWGTVSNADNLGGVPASDYVRKGNTSFAATVSFSDDGFTVGAEGDLLVEIENDNEAVLSNEVGELIKLKAKNSEGIVRNSLIIQSNSLVPGIRDIVDEEIIKESVQIGSPSRTFTDMYADNFWGISEQANTVLEGGEKRSASKEIIPNTLAVRDGSGNIKANLFRGTALTAKYADLAEIYSTDVEYPIGTVLTICNHEDHEAERANETDFPIGVISQNPAYLMNSDAEGQPVALRGRTPVRVLGKVRKGDKLTVNVDGVTVPNGSGHVVAIALESNENESEKTIEGFICV